MGGRRQVGWGKNLAWLEIYSIVQKGIKKTQNKSMETTLLLKNIFYLTWDDFGKRINYLYNRLYNLSLRLCVSLPKTIEHMLT